MIRGKGSSAEIKGIGLGLFRSDNSDSSTSLNPLLFLSRPLTLTRDKGAKVIYGPSRYN